MNAVTATPAERRVFFALWPDPATRDALHALARELPGPGRPVPHAHLHLTLAFAGTVGAPVAEALAQALAALPEHAVDLHLDRYGHFPGPRVSWIGPSSTPPGLEALASAATRACRAAGVRLEERPFRPHVTLRRHAPTPPEVEAPPVPVVWHANHLVLIESGRDGHPGPYRLLAERHLLSSSNLSDGGDR
ncbi:MULTISPECIES: RNA 2',3'-cyclic phosphodiesterase [unclassified Thioalkalivibrio]|uniref:RNA 2',3'-cyclic phosphodiesterase n=1 Tax=unclassified Thioalkalivibrio TaxID=2621013 RepID=UPI00037157F1|nr:MULTISPECIES: RNA 2',3'-cyclic phosphodiesterase [unclassified Thioalkalivibrio]